MVVLIEVLLVRVRGQLTAAHHRATGGQRTGGHIAQGGFSVEELDVGDGAVTVARDSCNSNYCRRCRKLHLFCETNGTSASCFFMLKQSPLAELPSTERSTNKQCWSSCEWLEPLTLSLTVQLGSFPTPLIENHHGMEPMAGIGHFFQRLRPKYA